MEELSEAQIAELEQDLLNLRSTLNASMKGTAQMAGTVDLDQPIGRLSRIDALQAQQMVHAQQRRTKIRLEQVANALATMGNDAYGDCKRCGDLIGYRRLKARPESPFCVACADG